jgi:hypothetical protein
MKLITKNIYELLCSTVVQNQENTTPAITKHNILIQMVVIILTSHQHIFAEAELSRF